MSASACFQRGALPLAGTADEISVFRSLEEVRALAPEWSELYRRAGSPNPFVSPEWVSACFDTVAAGSSPYVVSLRSGGRLTTVAPLRLETQLGFRTLRPAGSGWSPYAGFLVDPDEPEGEWTLLSLLAQRRREWDLLLITQLAEPVSRLHQLPVAPKGATCVIEPTPWPGSAYLARDVQWETLLAEGPGWLRHMAKKQRKFERGGGAWIRLTGDEAAERIGDVEWVESRSWQGTRGQTASHEKRTAVMRLLAKALRDADGSELWLAEIEGHPISYEVNFRLSDRLWMYRGAYDPAHARWSASGILQFLAIQHAWQSGIREYDMMSGGEEYKLSCTDAIRDLKQLTLVAGTLRGRLAYAALRAPKRFAESHPAGKRMVRFAARALRSPRAFLSGSAADARRAH